MTSSAADFYHSEPNRKLLEYIKLHKAEGFQVVLDIYFLLQKKRNNPNGLPLPVPLAYVY